MLSMQCREKLLHSPSEHYLNETEIKTCIKYAVLQLLYISTKLHYTKVHTYLQEDLQELCPGTTWTKFNNFWCNNFSLSYNE